MLTLKAVTFFVAHVFLKRLCLPMPSLSIDCRSLLQLINCNANKNAEISPHPAPGGGGGGGYSHTLPIRVCAAQRGRDFEAPDLERGIHFRGVF